MPDYELARTTSGILKKLRKERKMTQNELAVIMNISRSVVANWETMLRVPTIEQYYELSSVFDVPVSYLIGHSPAPKKDYVSLPKDDCIDLRKLNEEGKRSLRIIYEAYLKSPDMTEPPEVIF